MGASAVLSLRPGHALREPFERHNLSMTPFAIRLVRVVLPNGQIHILATSLLDEVAYPAREFAKLYRQRWQIEEAFRHIKCRLKLEQFGGETPLAIRQAFHATILLHNLATLAGLDALNTLDEDERHLWHVNLTHASHLLRINLPRLLRHPDEAHPCCAQIIATIARDLTRKRPDRTAPPRKPSRAKPLCHGAYK